MDAFDFVEVVDLVGVEGVDEAFNCLFDVFDLRLGKLNLSLDHLMQQFKHIWLVCFVYFSFLFVFQEVQYHAGTAHCKVACYGLRELIPQYLPRCFLLFFLYLLQ